MRSLLFGLSLVGCLGVAFPVAAEGHLVDGPAGCVALGGEWQAPAGCLLHRLVVGADDEVVVAASVALLTDGTVFNYGRMDVYGFFQPNGWFHNRGTLVTRGLTVNGGPIENTATFVNLGWIHTHAGVGNYGTLENRAGGYIETCGSAIGNYGYLQNSGDFDNWGTLFVNRGIYVNDGRTYNPDADFYRIDNFGAFENRGHVENGGTLSNACGGAVYGNGIFSGVPVQYEACDAGTALDLLTSRVFEAGGTGPAALPKKDIRDLTNHLAKAAKALALFNDRATATNEMQAFIDNVDALLSSGRIERYLGAAFAGWANQVIALL